jgi:Cysteine-rich secretory protein family
MYRSIRWFCALVASIALFGPALLVISSSPAVADTGPLATQFVALVNADRASAGQAPLTVDAGLATIAQDWTDSLAQSGTLSHNPNMSSLLPSDWTRWGENVGEGPTAPIIDQAFMASPEHRANALGQFSEIGVGVAVDADGEIFVTIDLLQVAAGVSAASCADGDPVDVPSSAAAVGYYVLGNDGGIFSYGNAPFYGSIPGLHLAVHAALMSLTPDQAGYWILTTDGGVYTFGDAHYEGSANGTNLTAVDLKPTNDGLGYWILGANGTVDAYGDAQPFGSATDISGTAVKLVPTPDSHGYWILTTTGSIYSFGDAAYHGSLAALGINDTAVSMASTADGNGYWILGADGGIFSFGDAAYHGSVPGLGCQTATGVQLIATHTGDGYYILSSDGRVFPFGDAPSYGQPFTLNVTTLDLAVVHQ